MLTRSNGPPGPSLPLPTRASPNKAKVKKKIKGKSSVAASQARLASAMATAYQDHEDDEDDEDYAAFSHGQPRSDPYLPQESDGATEDDESEGDDSDGFEEIKVQEDAPPDSYFHNLTISPSRLLPYAPLAVRVGGGSLPASSPIVSFQNRVHKKRQRTEYEQDVTGAPSTSNNAVRSRLPSTRELRGLVPESSTPKGVTFIQDDSFQRRDKHQQRSRRAPKPHQIGFHTPNTKHILRNAKLHYREGILFDDAYPGDEERARSAKVAWEWAIERNPEVFAAASMKTFNGITLRTIGDTGWGTRGAIKAEAKRIVCDHYHLVPPDSLTRVTPRECQEYTRNRIHYLLNNYKFLYGDFNGITHAPEQRTDMPFTDIALPIVIERAIFRNMTTQGRNLMNPMPAPLVALAATAIQNSLEEWASGYYQKKSMKEETYAPLYRKYCRKLAEIRARRPNRFLLMMTSFYAFCLQASRSFPPQIETTLSDDEDWQVVGHDSDDDEPLH